MSAKLNRLSEVIRSGSVRHTLFELSLVGLSACSLLSLPAYAETEDSLTSDVPTTAQTQPNISELPATDTNIEVPANDLMQRSIRRNETIESSDSAEINVRIIEPNIRSQAGKKPAIDDEHFELSFLGGSYKIDGFPVDFSSAIRFAYLLDSSNFVELEYLQTEADQSTLRAVGRPVISNDENVSVGAVSFGYSLVDAQLFFNNRRSLTSNLHIIAGMGRFHFGGSSYTSFSLGAGIRSLISDHMSFRIEVRSSLLKKNFLEPEDSFSHNIQFNAGVGFIF